MPKAKEPKIDVEFETLLPALSPKEYANLANKIADEGFTQPLRVWKETGILLDGHSRLRICKQFKLDYDTRLISLPSRAAAIAWIINDQLSRRNLTDEQRGWFIGKRYLEEKKATGRPKGGQSDHLSPEGHTADRIAAETGVSPRTVRRDAEFAEVVASVPPEAKPALLGGEISMATTLAAAKGEVVRCDRCRRFETPVKNCPNCKTLAAIKGAAPPPTRTPRKPAAPPKKGAELFDWRAYETHFGYVVRLPDMVARGYPAEKDSAEFREAHDLLRPLADLLKRWKKKLA